jgi:hypothetical protein
MSFAAIPAVRRAATIFRASAAFAVSAARAVWAWVTTPKPRSAMSGVVSTEPMPLTVIPVCVWSAARPCAASGRPTPATAAAARRSSATAEMRTSFMVPPVSGMQRIYAADPRPVTGVS